jgi:hypothetical protein
MLPCHIDKFSLVAPHAVKVDCGRLEGHQILQPGAVAPDITGYRHAFPDMMLLNEASNLVEITRLPQVPGHFAAHWSRASASAVASSGAQDKACWMWTDLANNHLVPGPRKDWGRRQLLANDAPAVRVAVLLTRREVGKLDAANAKFVSRAWSTFDQRLEKPV